MYRWEKSSSPVEPARMCGQSPTTRIATNTSTMAMSMPITTATRRTSLGPGGATVSVTIKVWHIAAVASRVPWGHRRTCAARCPLVIGAPSSTAATPRSAGPHPGPASAWPGAPPRPTRTHQRRDVPLPRLLCAEPAPHLAGRSPGRSGPVPGTRSRRRRGRRTQGRRRSRRHLVRGQAPPRVRPGAGRRGALPLPALVEVGQVHSGITTREPTNRGPYARATAPAGANRRPEPHGGGQERGGPLQRSALTTVTSWPP